MATTDAEVYIRIGEARELLGVNKVRMARYIKEGVLPAYRFGHDARVKWVNRAQVMALLRELQTPQQIEVKR